MSPALNEENFLRNSSSSCRNLLSLYREKNACYNRVPLVSMSIRWETAIAFAKSFLKGISWKLRVLQMRPTRNKHLLSLYLKKYRFYKWVPLWTKRIFLETAALVAETCTAYIVKTMPATPESLWDWSKFAEKLRFHSPNASLVFILKTTSVTNE